jgi:hypothetical protein
MEHKQDRSLNTNAENRDEFLSTFENPSNPTENTKWDKLVGYLVSVGILAFGGACVGVLIGLMVTGGLAAIGIGAAFGIVIGLGIIGIMGLENNRLISSESNRNETIISAFLTMIAMVGLGALIGTLICPGIGTLIGSAIGCTLDLLLIFPLTVLPPVKEKERIEEVFAFDLYKTPTLQPGQNPKQSNIYVDQKDGVYSTIFSKENKDEIGKSLTGSTFQFY